jgi:hypothetical protein
MRRDTAPDALIADILLISLFAIAVFAYFMVLSSALGDGDTGWHIAAGAWIIEHRTIPTTDPFSYSAQGKPWTAHEWLIEVVMYGLYRAAGWSGILAFYGIAAVTLFVSMALYLRRWLSPLAAAIPLAYCTIGLQPFLLARPHLLAWPLLAIWTIGLLKAREANNVPSYWYALLMIAWANLHASFLFGLLLIGPFALEALIAAERSDRMTVVWRWGAFGLACLAASLATPFGLQGLLFPLQVGDLTTLKFIIEWKPSNFATITPFEVILLSGMFFCLFKPTRIPTLRLMVLIIMLHLAFSHVRHQAIFLIVGTLILAEPFARAYRDQPVGPRFDFWQALDARKRELVPIFVVLSLLSVGLLTGRLIIPALRNDSYGVPVTAVTHLPVALRSKRVFNEYSFGGILILNKIPVFIDGRSDVYGDQFTGDYIAITNDRDIEKWNAAMRKWDFEWSILPPGQPLAKFLDHQPGWKRLYADKWAVIHVADKAVKDLGLGPLPAAGKLNSPALIAADRATTAQR